MLIARQRAGTWCYTSLESMNMRLCALLETSDGEYHIFCEQFSSARPWSLLLNRRRHLQWMYFASEDNALVPTPPLLGSETKRGKTTGLLPNNGHLDYWRQD